MSQNKKLAIAAAVGAIAALGGLWLLKNKTEKGPELAAKVGL